MKEQRKIPPIPLDEQELSALGVALKAAITEWAELEIPDTLGSLDLNPGNVLISAERCVFLDWAEAYLGPPFLTFEYLLGIARRSIGDFEDRESDLADCYLKHWRSWLSDEAMMKGRELAPLLAVFAYAAGTELWRDPARIKQRGVGGYLRSLTRRMRHEAKLYAGARSRAIPRCMA